LLQLHAATTCCNCMLQLLAQLHASTTCPFLFSPFELNLTPLGMELQPAMPVTATGSASLLISS
jgi:hypothetical protein